MGVMAGLVPPIHVFAVKTWMPGTRPGMTEANAKRRRARTCMPAQPDRASAYCSVAETDAMNETRGAHAGNVGLAEVNVTEFGPCGPMRGEQVLDTDTGGPTDCRWLLLKGSR